MNQKIKAEVPTTGPVKQRGVVLLIALIALFALSMAGIAFMRSIDASGLIAGNMSFNRAAIAISDVGMEQARAVLLDLSDDFCDGKRCLWKNQAGLVSTNAYWAQSQPGFDYRTTDWSQAFVVDNGTLNAQQQGAVAGYEIRYVVHRMCERAWADDTAANDGDPITSNCLSDEVTWSGGTPKGAVDYSNNLVQSAQDGAVPYYRVTLRVSGPRNTVTYLQVWLI
jgi:Tfp pilus assembly protein PilX